MESAEIVADEVVGDNRRGRAIIGRLIKLTEDTIKDEFPIPLGTNFKSRSVVAVTTPVSEQVATVQDIPSPTTPGNSDPPGQPEQPGKPPMRGIARVGPAPLSDVDNFVEHERNLLKNKSGVYDA